MNLLYDNRTPSTMEDWGLGPTTKMGKSGPERNEKNLDNAVKPWTR